MDEKLAVISLEHHNRIVAELKAEVDHLNRQLADAMSGCCDCPMFKAQGKTVAELRAENEILKSKASQFESTLKETMRVRDAEIEKLKRVVEKLKGMVSHYETCATVDRYDDEDVPCDCGLEKELDAIGKGSEIDKLREHFGYT